MSQYLLLADVENDQVNSMLASPNFIAADVVVISMRYGKNRDRTRSILIHLPSFLDRLNSTGKQLIIISACPEFGLSDNGKTLYDRELLSEVRIDSIGNFSYKVNLKCYEERNLEIDKKNNQIKELSEVRGIKFSDRLDLVCNIKEPLCYGITLDDHKAFYDYGHYTLEAAKYFGRRIHEMNWLELE